MPFISGGDRYQVMFTALDDMVAPDSEARVIDAFVGSLDLDAMGFAHAEAAERGRPAYEPAELLKLYVYGYRNGIRSSRKLARACEVNVEVMWLVSSLTPDFRTIANFRRDNRGSLKAVFKEFTRRVMAGMEPGFQSVDGTKVRASNAKDRNFTPSKLDDRIARLNSHVGEYLRLLDEQDAEDDAVAAGGLPRAELERKLAEAEERLARYEGSALVKTAGGGTWAAAQQRWRNTLLWQRSAVHQISRSAPAELSVREQLRIQKRIHRAFSPAASFSASSESNRVEYIVSGAIRVSPMAVRS